MSDYCGGSDTSDEVLEFLDYCYHAADPENVGKKVFCGVAGTHTATQSCSKFHVVRSITRPLKIINPGRQAKSTFISKRKSNSLFGDEATAVIDGNCNFDRRAREVYACENNV